MVSVSTARSGAGEVGLEELLAEVALEDLGGDVGGGWGIVALSPRGRAIVPPRTPPPRLESGMLPRPWSGQGLVAAVSLAVLLVAGLVAGRATDVALGAGRRRDGRARGGRAASGGPPGLAGLLRERAEAAPPVGRRAYDRRRSSGEDVPGRRGAAAPRPRRLAAGDGARPGCPTTAWRPRSWRTVARRCSTGAWPRSTSRRFGRSRRTCRRCAGSTRTTRSPSRRSDRSSGCATARWRSPGGPRRRGRGRASSARAGAPRCSSSSGCSRRTGDGERFSSIPWPASIRTGSASRSAWARRREERRERASGGWPRSSTRRRPGGAGRAAPSPGPRWTPRASCARCGSGANGALAPPAARAFWHAVFGGWVPPDREGWPAVVRLSSPADAAWLVEQAGAGDPALRRLRLEQVVFAQRVFAETGDRSPARRSPGRAGPEGRARRRSLARAHGLARSRPLRRRGSRRGAPRPRPRARGRGGSRREGCRGRSR